MKKLVKMFLCLTVLFLAVSTFAEPVPDVVQNQCRDNTGNPIICPSSGESFNEWNASFAINSNSNIMLDLNGNDLQVPHIPPEIMVQQDILSFYETINTSSNAGATGATISGTVYQSDGATPLTGKSILVFAWAGSPCGGRTTVGYISSNAATGIYTISGLSAGTYYLQTDPSYNYISEWWASPQSVRDCAGAQSIVVTEGQTVTGKNFQLEPGATISGTVYQSDGVTPLTGNGIYVQAYTGSLCGNLTSVGVGATFINSANGTYTIQGLPAETYYLQIRQIASLGNYISEWWASPLSVWDRGSAQPIVVTERQTVTGKNFQLELGATISGTVYHSDGTTPLTGKNIYVYVWTGSPCGSHQGVGFFVNSATGTYTTTGLPAGTYYLQTGSPDNYISEWWASPLSVRDCAGAQSVVVTGGQTVTDTNFQLDTGTTISGTVYQSNGVTPLTGKNIYIGVWTGSSCGSRQVTGFIVNSATGTYTTAGLPAGTYYLQAYSSDNYISEWWASPQSVRDCAGAQSIVVTGVQTVTDINFQLDTGATISGTVYQSEDVKPLTCNSINVQAYTGSPCSSSTYVGYASINSATGTYTIPGLPAGTYYLLAYSSDYHIGEWWALPQSVRDCAGAQSIVVTEGQTVTSKDFQLDLGGTLLSVSPVSRDVAKDAGVTTFSVSNTGTGTMPWTAAVTSGDSWLSITSGSSGINSGTINCSFTANTSTTARTATIRVTANGATGSPVDVTVTQAPTISKYVDNSDGTVTDTSTGLMWQQATAPNTYNWDQAISYCESLSFAGYTDWRLPTIDELKSLVDSRWRPTIDPTYFPNTVFRFSNWSSTTCAGDTYFAWGVYFYDGSDSCHDKPSSYYVRAVRGGQPGPLDHSVISVSPASRDVAKDAGATTFSVSNTGTWTMPWTAAATSGGSWLSITSGASGSDSGTINCSFTANTGKSARTATIRVTATDATGSPQYVTVTQAGKESLTILGSVKTSSGSIGVYGVTITFSNGGGTATTDGNGDYSLTISHNYSGTATPSKTGYTFSPPSKTYSNVTANKTGENYTATPLTNPIIGSNSIDAIDVIKITDMSGSLPDAGGAVTVRAWDKDGKQLTASGYASPLSILNHGTTSILGADLEDRFLDGAPAAYTFSVESSKMFITNINNSIDGAVRVPIIYRNGLSNFVSNSIGSRNTLKVTDMSGAIASSGIAITVTAWDATGKAIPESTSAEPLKLNSHGTTIIAGSSLPARFPSGTPMTYQFTIASPKLIVSNVKNSSGDVALNIPTVYTVGGGSFVSNTIGFWNTIYISDFSGKLDDIGGAAINVRAWDASGKEILESVSVSSYKIFNYKTITITGTELASRFSSGVPMTYEFTVDSPNVVITNVKSNSNGSINIPSVYTRGISNYTTNYISHLNTIQITDMSGIIPSGGASITIAARDMDGNLIPESAGAVALKLNNYSTTTIEGDDLQYRFSGGVPVTYEFSIGSSSLVVTNLTKSTDGTINIPVVFTIGPYGGI